MQVSDLGDVTAIAGGYVHTLALKSDGTVWAWGNNMSRQLGDGTLTNKTTPVKVRYLSGFFTAIAAGGSNSLALKSDGTVWEWGGEATTPAQVSGLSDVIAVAGGTVHTLALKSDGTVWAWGDNSYGQLGDGTTTDRDTPVQVSGLNGVTAIAGRGGYGGSHSLALKSDGTVWAWGYNGSGQLGDGTKTNWSTPVQVSGLSDVTAIGGGGLHTLALKSDGTVWTWGDNKYGQLGDGTTTNRKTPVQVSGLSGVVAIAAGEYHTLALKSDGTAWAWGWNAEGQLGDGTGSNTNYSKKTPVQVSGINLNDATATSTPTPSLTPSPTPTPAPSAMKKILARKSHSLVVKSDGTVWAWGDNEYGQLGDVTTNNRSYPVRVSGLSGVTAIAGGGVHTLALKSDGTVWAWGGNDNGQLGNGTTIDSITPAQVGGLSDVTAIGGGSMHTLVVKSDGTVWAWGDNEYGQLGNGTTIDRSTPVQISGLSGVTAIAGGWRHTIALKSDGTVWAWGDNTYGQLGDGTTMDSITPIEVYGLSGVTAIAAEEDHTVALKSDGTVWEWGYGQVMYNKTPTEVSGLSSVMAIARGSNDTGALKSDGTVWVWGEKTPVQVSGLSGVTAIARGRYHTLALTSNGTVWAWGDNDYGQLGEGTMIDMTTPVPVSGINLNDTTAGGITVSGYISADTTWAAESSPYSVTGNVIVKSGVTLTIEPGVTVNFDAGKSLYVYGTLLAKGTNASRITFTGSRVAIANWGNIVFNDSSADATYNAGGNYAGGSILEYCTVEYSSGANGIEGDAIRLNSAHPFINRCIIRNNYPPGIYADDISGKLMIMNSLIANNDEDNSWPSRSRRGTIDGVGICVYHSSGGKTTISGNTITGNNAIINDPQGDTWGGGIYIENGTVKITNNIISKNNAMRGGGIRIYGASIAEITNNTISGNTAQHQNTCDGGGISIMSSTVKIMNNTISGNTVNYMYDYMYASGEGFAWGGGVYIGSSTVTLVNNTISGNTAYDCSAVYYEGGDGKDFKYNTITGNKATADSDSATVCVGSDPLLNYNNIYSNTADYELWFDLLKGLKNLDAKNNWWGTSNKKAIQGKIYDGMDDKKTALVDYLPYLTAIYDDAGATKTAKTTPAGTGNDVGCVIDDDAYPLSGKTVSMAGEGRSSSTTTDADGYCKFNGPAAGAYTHTDMESEAKGKKISLDAVDVVEMDTAMLKAVQKGRIYGYVVDAKGYPMESVNLKLGREIGGTELIATDQDGYFEFAELDAGEYTIRGKKKGYKDIWTGAIELMEGEERELLFEAKKKKNRVKAEVLE